jgi:hypothetical protein
MAIQTFTASQVLTAAQMNTLQANDYNQTVSTKTASYTLVAADKGTRVVMNVASANTVTVNTSLFSAGDTLVIQNIGAGVTTVTAGTATVSSAAPLTISQYGSGTLYFTSAGVSLWFPSAGPAATSGFTLIGTQTISAATMTFTSAFSATYRNYKLLINNIQSASGAPDLLLTYGSASTGYQFCRMFANQLQTWTFGSGSAAASSINLETLGQTQGLQMWVEIMSPFIAEKTFSSSWSGTTSSANFKNSLGIQEDATSFTAFTLSNSGAISMTGTVSLYGYAL